MSSEAPKPAHLMPWSVLPRPMSSARMQPAAGKRRRGGCGVGCSVGWRQRRHSPRLHGNASWQASNSNCSMPCLQPNQEPLRPLSMILARGSSWSPTLAFKLAQAAHALKHECHALALVRPQELQQE